MVTGKKAVAKKAAKKTPAAPAKALHRTGATEKHNIPGYPTKLYIYKLDASKYWWVRYFLNGNAVRKTTKAEGKREAIAFAKEFHDVVTYNQRHGIHATVSATSFDACKRELMKTEKAKLDRGELAQITYDNTNYRFDKHITPYFRTKEVREIDYNVLNSFLNEMSKLELSSNTISMYMGLVRKVLVHAARRKLIIAVPEFPKVTVKESPRGWFNTREYRRLWCAASRYIGERMEVRKYVDAKGVTQTQYINTNSKAKKLGKVMRYVDMTEDLRRLIVFMCNSYIRPTDVKFMQHKHVDVFKAPYTYLRLRIPPTKGHSDPITTMPKAVECYEQLKQHHLATGQIGKEHDDDYVFMPQYKTNRSYALKQLQRQFEILMVDTKLGKGVAGEERTLYSLRHTAIMYRLLFGDGINTLLLARNARTSVEMIDRFYAKPLSGEMNIEALQSRRRPRKFFDGDMGQRASVEDKAEKQDTA
jgi:hypothetical protein